MSQQRGELHFGIFSHLFAIAIAPGSAPWRPKTLRSSPPPRAHSSHRPGALASLVRLGETGSPSRKSLDAVRRTAIYAKSTSKELEVLINAHIPHQLNQSYILQVSQKRRPQTPPNRGTDSSPPRLTPLRALNDRPTAPAEALCQPRAGGLCAFHAAQRLSGRHLHLRAFRRATFRTQTPFENQNKSNRLNLNMQ